MEIVSIIFDVILIACMGRLIFECGVWSEKVKRIEALCACVGDISASVPDVKPPEATETDFEGVKIWKPCQKKKASREPQKALQT